MGSIYLLKRSSIFSEIFYCIINILVYFLLSWENLLADMFHDASSKSRQKISYAPYNQSYSILNYLIYFFTRVLFYDLFITHNSLGNNWNLIKNFLFFYFLFLQKFFSSDFVLTESFSFYLSLSFALLFSLYFSFKSFSTVYNLKRGIWIFLFKM